MKYKVELEFDVDEKIELYTLAWYLGYNQQLVINSLFIEYDENGNEIYRNGIIPDDDCSYRLVKIEEIKDK